MNILEAKYYVDTFLASTVGKKDFTPDEIIKKIFENESMTVGEEHPITAKPKMGYIPSNIKGYYYIIYCDSCNKRCRKVYPLTINYNGTKVLRFLCNRCAGRKYERKKEDEKRALGYLLHPESIPYENINNMPLKQSMALLEAGFIQDTIRERAEKNASKYLGIS